MFTWTPSADLVGDLTLTYSLQIQATDELGASAIWWPTVKLCACSSAIQCDWVFMNNLELTPSAGGLPYQQVTKVLAPLCLIAILADEYCDH